MNVPDSLLSQAMQLPEDARASLAQQLLLSLEPSEPEPGYEAAWQAEIETRLAELDAGTEELIDRHEAMSQVRDALAKGKSL